MISHITGIGQWISDMISSWEDVATGNVDVTVSYESLEVAADEAIVRINTASDCCAELEALNSELCADWDSKACESLSNQLRDRTEALQQMLQKFRKHSENLREISHRYVQTSHNIGSLVQGLSDDVIL